MKIRYVLLLLLLAACVAQPTYVPDQTILATREAQEYANVRIYWNATKITLQCFLVLALLTLLGVSIALATIGYKYQDAKAIRKLAEAKKQQFLDLGDGRLLNIETLDIIDTAYPTIPETDKPEKAKPFVDLSLLDEVSLFVAQAAKIVGEDNNVLPRWDAWKRIGLTMSSATWVRLTGILGEMNLIDKHHGRTTMVANNLTLGDVLRRLPHPTERDEEN